MRLNEYQESIKEFRLETADEFYALLGLIGEVGEMYSLLAKDIRDDDGTLTQEKLTKELGDILWFIAAIASDFDIELEEAATKNIAKLRSRKNRGVIGGSGDDR